MGQNTLIRFYALHIMMIPLALIIIISLHIWRVRKDGGLAGQVENETHLEIAALKESAGD